MKTIFTILSLILLFDLVAQPGTGVEELFRKRHVISGMNYGHPYTTFDTHNINYVDLPNAINNMRKRIISENVRDKEGPIFLAYQDIYKNATDPHCSESCVLGNSVADSE